MRSGTPAFLPLKHIKERPRAANLLVTGLTDGRTQAEPADHGEAVKLWETGTGSRQEQQEGSDAVTSSRHQGAASPALVGRTFGVRTCLH